MSKFIYLFIFVILLFASMGVAKAISMLNDNDNTNDKKAISILKKNSKSGDRDAGFLLGSMYKKGLIVDKDLDKSIQYYTLSADAGDIDSLLILSWHYYENNNTQKAIYLLKKAKDLGSAESIELLKLMGEL